MSGIKTILLAAMIVVGVSCGRLDHLGPQGYAPASASAFAGPAVAAGSFNGGNNGAPPFHFENVNNGDGSYKFSYDTPNGISAHESGAPRAPGPEGLAVTAEGGFSYRTPDGQQISLTYTADENGFHPVGSHLPTPPPIPEAIQRSLEFNRQNPSSDSGSYNNGGSNGYHY
ncbi:hypothetical protein K1T71_007330 [Dendrolimus kikuchii]|uniref:Uncharacterized protein n=1 Tax=Dendrolimus kikuchii TaxID=765133 RepID=A0ACC1D0G1_9NEOP|nr:hypothetical protein K1T71_007330 [Dendrolimus kikuchii]